MKKLIFLLALLFITQPKAFSIFQPVAGIESAQVKTVVVSKFTPSLIYIASDNSLYESQDSGENFKKIAVFKDEEARHIFFDPSSVDALYVVTSRHLYRWQDRLEKLFSAQDEQTIYSAVKYKGVFYIGTNQGLYFSAADVLKWSLSKNISDLSVFYIEPAKTGLYLAAEQGVYFLNDDNTLTRLFFMRKGEPESEEGEEETPERGNLTARVIKVDSFDDKRVWLGTTKGLFVSYDSGSSWEKLYLAGIDSLDINCLDQAPQNTNSLYVGTNNGFFEVNFAKNQARQIFEGLFSSDIKWLAFAPSGKIYLATSRGLFQNDYFSPSTDTNRVELLLSSEPSIIEVQQAALHYNEVHPDKIKKWRNGLKYRALFPDLSLNYDKTVYTAASSTSGTGYSFIGPLDWGVSLSWDVGDLIWNSYEDDVDTRARLNTQLRLDILDEINRLYFERLRLSQEITAGSLSQEEFFKKKLRLAELTAIIDGYTGGFFSQRKQELSRDISN